METLNFSYNWNKKLDCNFFTTLRLSNRFQVGEIVEVRLKKERRNNSQIVSKKCFYIEQLDEFTAALDTGYNRADTIDILRRMYKDVDWSTQKVFCYLVKVLGKEKSTIPELF